jgi:hypothetical protein
MGLRFRRKIRVLPGVAINLPKSGISASLGKPGFTVNVNKDGHQTTFGLPGSGLSYQVERAPWPAQSPPSPPCARNIVIGVLLALVGLVLLVANFGAVQ